MLKTNILVESVYTLFLDKQKVQNNSIYLK